MLKAEGCWCRGEEAIYWDVVTKRGKRNIIISRKYQIMTNYIRFCKFQRHLTQTFY